MEIQHSPMPFIHLYIRMDWCIFLHEIETNRENIATLPINIALS